MDPPPINSAAGAVSGCWLSHLSGLAQSASATLRLQQGHAAAACDANRWRLRHSKCNVRLQPNSSHLPPQSTPRQMGQQSSVGPLSVLSPSVALSASQTAA
eukprot:11394767-Alexandrium_andersonii.AAC.1